MSPIIRTRKIFVNKVLNRKQLVVDIIHPNLANVSRVDVAKNLANRYKVDERNIVVYGLRTQFGGGRSTGFALLYDTQQYLLKYEPKYVLRRRSILPARTTSRKAWKELKHNMLKKRGKEVTKLWVARKFDKPEVIRKVKEDYLKTFGAK